MANAAPEIAAIADVKGRVFLVDSTGNVRFESTYHDVADVALMQSEQSTLLAIAESAGVTLVHDLDGERKVDRLAKHEGRATGVALFGSEVMPTWIISADERGNVIRCGASNRQSVAFRRLHRKAVSRLVATRLADGRDAFLTASDDRDVLVCEVASGNVIARFSSHAGWIEQAVPLSHGQFLWGVAVVDRVGLTIWEVETGLAAGRVTGKATANLATIWHPAIGSIVSFATPDAVALWSLEGINSIAQPTRDAVRASAIATDSRGQTIVMAAAGNTILHCTSDTGFVDTGIRFPAPVLQWLPWESTSGALVVLEDGSIWNAEW
jgi:hypothetical protein